MSSFGGGVKECGEIYSIFSVCGQKYNCIPICRLQTIFGERGTDFYEMKNKII
jgi:hypothetical protein